jgi:opacity protein-like surface antigen
MRKHFVLGLTLLLVLAAAVFAADSKASPKQYHRTHGDIASVDATTQTFTVKHGNDTSTFKTDNATKYRGAGKEITFADLQVGDDVRVSFTENGTDKTAARVDVVHGPKVSKPHS